MESAGELVEGASRSACWTCGGPSVPAKQEWLAGQLYCPACGLVFRATGGAELAHDLYLGEKYLAEFAGGAVGQGPEPLREQEARVRVRLLHRLVAQGRVLEIGAAGGHFLSEARHAGYDVLGIEPTDNGVESARRRGLEILQGFVEEIELPAQSLDAACAFHVIEHIPDPLKTLERLRGWMRPGAALLIEVPNAISRRALRQRGAWEHLDLTHHVAQYTPSALRALLDHAGFSIEYVRTVAYTMYRPAHAPVRWISAARQFSHSGGVPWRPHRWRYELLQAAARAP